MAAGQNTREVRLEILTDRVVTSAANQNREWALHDRLHTMEAPLGFKDCVKPVIVIANRVEHLAPLLAVGVALANRCAVDDSDRAVGADRYRFERATRSSRLINAALSELDEARLAGTLEELVYVKLRGMLLNAGSDRVPFSKNWEYAAPLYATMTLQDWCDYETAMVFRLLGKARSQDSERQDRRRGRAFMQAVTSGRHNGLLNAPISNMVELTEKYLSKVMPLILPTTRTDPQVSLSQQIVVTPRSVRVTIEGEKSGHEKKCRPSRTLPLPPLPEGFTVGT